MMLGLIWTLIYHYQITNKAEILKWVKGLCAPLNIPVVNFTTSWNSGLPLCVLSESLAHKRGVGMFFSPSSDFFYLLLIFF